ncbi:MAG: hypothetical protein ABFQ62_03000 [Patescibacteria group bacterium]
MRKILAKPLIKSLVILLVFLFLISRGLFSSSMPVTHDLGLHAPRLVNYYLAVKQGQIPPMWAPNLNYGFGYPSFIFTYPYPYAVSSTFYALGFSVESSLNLFLISSMFLSGLGVFVLSFLKTKKAFLSLLPAFLYICAPYFLLNIFIRGAIGEVSVLSLLPWVFLLGELTAKKTSRLVSIIIDFLGVLVLLAFILSHQILAAFGLLIAVLRFWRNRRFLLFIALALLVSAFSLLPMLLEKQFVRAGASEEYLLKHDIGGHVSIKNLLFSKWEYSGLVDSSENGRFAKTVGVSQWMVFIVAVGVLLKNKDRKIEDKINIKLFFWILISLFLIFLILPISMPFWRVFKFLEYLQFPWRLLGLLIFSITMILIELVQLRFLERREIKILGLLVVLATFWALIFQAKPAAYTAKDDLDWHHFPLTADSYGEIMPVWFDSNRNLKLDKQLVLRWETGELSDLENNFSEIQWLGSKMSYSVESSQSAEVIQKTAYFPGWEARVNNKQVDVNYKDTEYPGRIIIPIEKGQSKIELEFSNNTWARKVGGEITLLGLVLWMGWVGWKCLEH